jgi:CHAT domain-containing protein/Tfp pilus assembly protein PilF
MRLSGNPGCLLIAELGLVCGCSGQALEPARPIEATLGGGSTQSYSLAADAGQYFRINIEPNGLPLDVHLLAPSGKEVGALMNEAGELRDIPISNIAAEGGTYRLTFASADPDAPARAYRITLIEIRAARPDDATRVGAEQAFQNGKRLKAQGSKEQLQKAVAAFESVLPLWRSVADQTQEGRTLDAMGDTYWSLGQPAPAKDCFTQALALAKAANDRVGEASALSNLGVTAIFADPKKAAGLLEESLLLSRESDHNLQAETLSNLGALYMRMGDLRKSLDYANRALELKRESGDRKGQMLILTNVAALYSALGDPRQSLDRLGDILSIRRQMHDQRGEAQTLFTMATAFAQLGEPDKALDLFGQVLPLRRVVGDRIGEAQALQNMGAAQMSLSELQEALTTFQTALPLSRELKDLHLEESFLNNIARAYLQLGEFQRALGYSTRALQIQRQIGDKRGEAVALSSLGSVYADMGDSQRALELYDQALPLFHNAGDRAGEADILGVAGLAFAKRGEPKRALEYILQELDLSRQIEDRRREAVALVNAGDVYIALSERRQASDSLEKGLAMLVPIGDRVQQSRALYQLARLERSRGEWLAARGRLDEALRMDEQIRGEVVDRELRSSYFATVIDQYEMLIELLMRLHKEHPGRKFDVQAFDTSERARARSLLDLLGESRAGLRQGVDPALLDRERILIAQLRAKSERRTEMLAAKKTDPRLAPIEADIRRLTIEYQELQARILASSPRYAEFTRSHPLTLEEIQSKVVDSGTLLLEYSMGVDRSFVWAVTSTTFRTYELPKRSYLEALARRVVDGIASADVEAARQASAALKQLGHALLDPVAVELGNRRLVVVAQGALQYVPFAALPSPTHGDEPLAVAHAIVTLPSASSIAFARGELENRPRASKVLAVLADPVYSVDDPRVSPATPPIAANAEAPPDRPTFQRLLSTHQEGMNILGLVRPRERLSALDFDASRATASSGALSQYRFVHIASHGILDSLHPELSGLVLSLVDRAGRPQNGFMQTPDIYNLKLNADMVVLSACQTALGREDRGEGLVGLTRAFLYAGVPRVVASLWTVPDVSTAQLMTRFYKGILVNGLRPSEALRQAQVSIWKEQRWARPYYWAGFTLQGEWR